MKLSRPWCSLRYPFMALSLTAACGAGDEAEPITSRSFEIGEIV